MASSTSSTSANSGVLQSLGLGSGLDISSLVSELTTAEMSASNSRIKREQSAVDTQVSALATFKSALSTFQSSISSFTSTANLDSRSTSSSDEDVFTAVSVSSAGIGSYDITVKQLAKSQQLASTVFTGGASTVVGTGTLSLSLGSNSNYDITIDSSNNTLSGIRDAINKATGTTGISATLVYGSTGAQLLLSATRTGASNTIKVDTSGGDGGLSALVYKSGNTANYTEKQAPQDSIVTVAGVEHKDASNYVSGAIDGVTLTLKKASPDTTETLSISNDTSHVSSLLKSFITAYNTLNRTLSSLGSYDSSSKKAGAMLGDTLLTGTQSQISRILSSEVTSVKTSYTSLSSLGISRNKDGSLSLDSSKLDSALSDNAKSVTDMLTAKDGAMVSLNDMMTKALASGASIDARSSSLDRQQKAIDSEQSLIDKRTEVVRQRYLDKFNAMDSLLAQLNNTSSYLTEQFKALNKSE